MREEVLEIINSHELSHSCISRLATVPRDAVRAYTIGSMTGTYEYFFPQIEEKVIEWRNKMIANRRRLLSLTRYAQLYR